MNAETDAPDNGTQLPVSDTSAPSASSTIAATVTGSPSLMPSYTATFFETGTSAPTATMSPTISPVPVLDAETDAPGNSTATEGNNSTSNVLCKSNMGSFFLDPEDNGSLSSFVYDLDVLSFGYELEMKPGASAEDILPDLEHAIVDRLLPILFPNACTGTESRLRMLQLVPIVGISAVPDDETTDCKFNLFQFGGVY